MNRSRRPVGEGAQVDGIDRAARLLALAAADAPAEVDEPTRIRIRARIRTTLGLHHRRVPARRLRYAMIVIVALAGGGVVGASIQSAIARRATARARGRSAAPPVPAARRAVSAGHAPLPGGPRSDVPSPSFAPAASALPETSAVSARRSPGRAPATLGARTPSLAASAASSAVASGASPRDALVGGPAALPRPEDEDRLESAVLADAIRKLRVDGDAASALALLTEHAARLRRSPLAAEASVIRVEALLQQRQERAALAELEGLPIDALPRRTEWHVIRGELRAATSDWAGAEADFAAALQRLSGVTEEIAERALWGRAVVRARRGDAAGARVDFGAYIGRFPAGRFAAEARARVLAP